MRYTSSMRCPSGSANAVIQFAGRYLTNIGMARLGKVTVEAPVAFWSNHMGGGEVSANYIGAFSYFNYNPDIRMVSSIGRFCEFAQNVVIGQGDHSLSALSPHVLFETPFPPFAPFWEGDPQWVSASFQENLKQEQKRRRACSIGHDVWVGCNSIVLHGVNIGSGAVIGAGAVVTKDVPPYAIVAGNPARVIRRRFSDQTIERLLRLEWWNYGPDVLKGLPVSHPEKALDALEERISRGFPLYEPDKFEFDTREQIITKISAKTGKREIIHDFRKKDLQTPS